MVMSPNPENYTLGKGVLYFNRKDLISGIYQGERDLGNAPAFSFNVALEKLDHSSSRGGIKSKDKEIISQMTPGLTFTLDEVTKENLSLLTLGDITTINQVIGGVADEVVVAKLGMRSELANRKIGLHSLPHGTVTSGPFVVGEVVTGSTSGATGIVAVVGADYIQVATTALAWDAADPLTGGTSAATATMSAAAVFMPGAALVRNEAEDTTYVAGTDYEISTTLKDDEIGRILVLSGGTITADENLHITYGHLAYTYNEIAMFANTQVEGIVRFVSDNPAGKQYEVQFWRVSLTPSGDTAMIGDDWSTLGFVGEVLKDETKSNPFGRMILPE